MEDKETAADACKKRRKKRKSCGPCRKFRAGRRTRNAFLNFLRAFRKRCCGRTASEIAVRGAKIWKRMSKAQKAPYRLMACKTPKRRRRKKSCAPCTPRRRRRKSRCRCASRRRRRSKCSRKKKQKPACAC